MSIAVLIPCYNEAATIRKVVQDFAAALPDATIYVYDNNSVDNTAVIAAAAGAIVRREPMQGKGHAIRRMFTEIDADVYLMVDGDDTYDAASAPSMVSKLITERLDVVNGVRVSGKGTAYPPGHRLGNEVFTRLMRLMFGPGCADVLSGYRVFSSAFVKSFSQPVTGFDIEVALTAHALTLRVPIGDVKTPYRERPAGSHSKLRTFHDGLRILRTVLRMAREERPLRFYGLVALLFAATAGVSAVRFLSSDSPASRISSPAALALGGSILLSLLSLARGLMLKGAAAERQQERRRTYERPASAFPQTQQPELAPADPYPIGQRHGTNSQENEPGPRVN